MKKGPTVDRKKNEGRVANFQFCTLQFGKRLDRHSKLDPIGVKFLLKI